MNIGNLQPPPDTEPVGDVLSDRLTNRLLDAVDYLAETHDVSTDAMMIMLTARIKKIGIAKSLRDDL
jgi:hypothetical protein